MRFWHKLNFSRYVSIIAMELGTYDENDYRYHYKRGEFSCTHHKFGKNSTVYLSDNVVFNNGNMFAWEISKECQNKVLRYVLKLYDEALEHKRVRLENEKKENKRIMNQIENRCRDWNDQL